MLHSYTRVISIKQCQLRHVSLYVIILVSKIYGKLNVKYSMETYWPTMQCASGIIISNVQSIHL